MLDASFLILSILTVSNTILSLYLIFLIRNIYLYEKFKYKNWWINVNRNFGIEKQKLLFLFHKKDNLYLKVMIEKQRFLISFHKIR